MEDQDKADGSAIPGDAVPQAQTNSGLSLATSGLAIDVLLATFPDIEPDLVRSIHQQSDSPETALEELRALRSTVGAPEGSPCAEDAVEVAPSSGEVRMVQSVVDPSAVTELESLFIRFPDIDPGVVSVVLSEVDNDSAAAARLLEGMRGDIAVPFEGASMGVGQGSSAVDAGSASARSSARENLARKFPGMEPELISLLLDDCDGNVERTTEMLSSLTTTQQTPDETTPVATDASPLVNEGGCGNDGAPEPPGATVPVSTSEGDDENDNDDFTLVSRRNGRADQRPISEPPVFGKIISMPPPEYDEGNTLETLVEKYEGISPDVVAMLWSESGEDYGKTVKQLALLSGEGAASDAGDVVTGSVGDGTTVSEVPTAVEGSGDGGSLSEAAMLTPEALRARYPDVDEDVFSVVISNCRGDLGMADIQLKQLCGVEAEPTKPAQGASSSQPPAVWIDSGSVVAASGDQPGTPLGAALFEDFFSKPEEQGQERIEERSQHRKEPEETGRQGVAALDNLAFFVEMFPEFEADDLAHVLSRSVDADEALEVLLAFTTDDLIDPLPAQVDQDVYQYQDGLLDPTKNVVRSSLEGYMNPGDKPSYKSVALKNAPVPTETPPVCPPGMVDKGKQKVANAVGSKYYEREKIYDNYRDRVSELAEKRNSCFRRANESWNSGNRITHLDHLQKGRMYAKLMEEAQREASDAIFEEINKHNPSKLFIDLHGLHVNEAVRKLKERIQQLRTGHAGGDLRIVTGRGKNSYTGPKLLPAVKGYLEQCNIPYSIKIGSVVAHLQAQE